MNIIEAIAKRKDVEDPPLQVFIRNKEGKVLKSFYAWPGTELYSLFTGLTVDQALTLSLFEGKIP